tara:strand:- start:97 stop:273 length:177 start_codon:yes stop_codon:yes gene_type:complete
LNTIHLFPFPSSQGATYEKTADLCGLQVLSFEHQFDFVIELSLVGEQAILSSSFRTKL